ncbi:MAG: hypothetical protein Kow0042_28230 [Calditrichia bacterium]
MLKPKKKITRRELKEDKFVTFTLKARDFIEENAKLLVRVGIGVLILIILVSFYVRSKRSANIQANALLGEAQLLMMQGDTSRVETLLKQLVEDYSGVTAAGQGCFLLGKLYWEKEDFTQAETYFKKYIDDYADDDLLTASALAGYADCLFQKGEIREAARNYEKAGRINRELPLSASYLYSAARAYMDIQETEKARALAEEIIKNYETSDFKDKAEILLNMIKYNV